MSNNNLLKVDNRLIRATATKQFIVRKIEDELFYKVPNLIPYRKGNRWGFCNRNKEIIIGCIYEDVELFYEGLAAVKLNGKWGFIDKNGIFKIANLYDSVSQGISRQKWLNNKLLRVCLNNKYGIINKEGSIIVEFEYDFISAYSEELFEVKKKAAWGAEQHGLVNYMGMVKLKCEYAAIHKISTEGLGEVKCSVNEKYGLVDEYGELLSPCIYDSIYHFSDCYAKVLLDQKYGYVNENGVRVIDCIYGSCWDFSDGYALTFNWEEGYSYINKKGEKAFQKSYEYACSFSEGLAAVKIDGKWGYINVTGQLVIECKYNNASYFSEGLAGVGIEMDERIKIGYIDKNGNAITKFIYDYGWGISTESDFCFKQGVARVSINGKLGLINNKGEQIVDCIYEHISDFHEGMAGVVFNKYLGYINKSGRTIIQCKYTPNYGAGGYSTYYHFKDGCVLVNKNHKVGYFNKKGEKITECIYDFGYSFYNGLAKVKFDCKEGTYIGKEGYIDQNGCQYWED